MPVKRPDVPPFSGKRITVAPGIAVTAAIGLTVVSWVIAVRQMHGMDMGAAARLGPFASFIGVWVPMMVAMMLPGAVPAIVEHARAHDRPWSVPLFVASYVAVWSATGVVVYAAYRPHSTVVAGMIAIVAGLYEFTPLKRHCRQQCRAGDSSGLQYGIYCVGSSVGLMALLLALGIMSIAWMSVITLIVAAQKLLPPIAAVDLLVGSAIVGLGVLILIAPSVIPGLAP